MKVLIAQSCPAFWDQPYGHSPPGSSVHRILQARILQWVVIPFSRVSSWPRDWTWVSCIAGWFFTIWATIFAYSWTSPVVLVVKNPPANAGEKRPLAPWARKIPWGGAQQPTPVFLPGKSHGQWSVAGYSSRGCRVRQDWSDLAQQTAKERKWKQFK